MDTKPELIIFSHKITTGIYSFYHNLLRSNAREKFDTTVIFHDNDSWTDSKAESTYNLCKEIIFEFKESHHLTAYEMASELDKFISNKKGAIVTNFITEMIALHIHPKEDKTIYFICHDENHFKIAIKYNFLIDVFIAHNPIFCDKYIMEFPDKINRTFYLPYGIELVGKQRKTNLDRPLNIVWLARLMHHKGIHHIPLIDKILKENKVFVNWTIIGDGPEKKSLLKNVSSCNNFSFFTPKNFEAVSDLLEQQDIYILPSLLDGLPVAMIEAMSVGCVPVISEFNGGIKKIITSDIGFVLPVNDNMSFVNTIIKIHLDRDLLEKLSDAARRKIHLEYDAQIQSRKYFDLFARYEEFRSHNIFPQPKYRWKYLGKIVSPRVRGRIMKLFWKK